MTIFFTECVFFRRAITEILEQRLPASRDIIIVMDARFFSGPGHMLRVCNMLRCFTSPVKIIVMLNGKDIAEQRELFPSGIHIQDSLARWTSVMRKIIRSESSLEETIRCLKKITGQRALHHKHHITMDFIRQDVTIAEMAGIMNISPKTVYGYLNDLKLYFNQPRLCNLYHFIKK